MLQTKTQLCQQVYSLLSGKDQKTPGTGQQLVDKLVPQITQIFLGIGVSIQLPSNTFRLCRPKGKIMCLPE